MFRREDQPDQAVLGGTVAGIVGGLVVLLFNVAAHLAHGGDAWGAFKGAGAPFLGTARAFAPGFDPYAMGVGFVSHMAVSVAWGMLFTLFAYGLSKGMTLVAGLAWGIVVWIGMVYVVLPIVGLGGMARSMPVGQGILTHEVFGLAVAIGLLPFQRQHVRTRLGRILPAR